LEGVASAAPRQSPELGGQTTSGYSSGKSAISTCSQPRKRVALGIAPNRNQRHASICTVELARTKHAQQAGDIPQTKVTENRSMRSERKTACCIA
jgi:hypothetical protein